MHVIVEPDAPAAARRAATLVEAACMNAVSARGQACIAFSGGETPWLMLDQLQDAALPWEKILVAQVDERIAPAADPRRNLHRLRELLVTNGSLPARNLLAMPVGADDLESAARSYQAQLEARAGAPLQFDLVQLGLGADGHTASLVSGDRVLEIADRDVAIGARYRGTQRMTLTFPAINRARSRLWLVTGESKRGALTELLSGQGGIPAARVATAHTTVVTDVRLDSLPTAQY